MIFVTVGTQKFQFNRLLTEIDNLCESNVIKSPVIAQTGSSSYEPKSFKSYKLLTQEKMNDYISQADLVITHGGTSSIFHALKLQKKVIVVPRLQQYGEHVDNHQKEISEILEMQGYISVAWDINDLQDLILNIENINQKIYKGYSEMLVNEIKNYVK